MNQKAFSTEYCPATFQLMKLTGLFNRKEDVPSLMQKVTKNGTGEVLLAKEGTEGQAICLCLAYKNCAYVLSLYFNSNPRFSVSFGRLGMSKKDLQGLKKILKKYGVC